eukprot:TRINITY_DN5945_c0_g3_i2.p1 TRINITY_DN5945_c0_g3~~TRINITY_DN5945_c0_g3_i2.p1  ORF type:complete len:104 (-),score=8.00 TRINITY_DN5945_c0_g3_i2:311-622(-)
MPPPCPCLESGMWDFSLEPGPNHLCVDKETVSQTSSDFVSYSARWTAIFKYSAFYSHVSQTGQCSALDVSDRILGLSLADVESCRDALKAKYEPTVCTFELNP